MLYMVTFTINIPQMLAYIPYMDPMGTKNQWYMYYMYYMAMAAMACYGYLGGIYVAPKVFSPKKHRYMAVMGFVLMHPRWDLPHYTA